MGAGALRSRNGRDGVAPAAHPSINQYRVRPKVFDPKAYVKIILDAAYASGRAYAETMHGLTATPPDAAALEKARDLHCEALTAAVSRTAALDTLTLAQGVYTSAFSGFEDRLREFRSVANVPPKVYATAELDDRPRGFDTGLFEKDAT